MIGKTFYQPVKEEVRYLIDKTINKRYIVLESPEDKDRFNEKKQNTEDFEKKEVKSGLLTKAINLNKVEFLVPQDPNFSLIIPKIGANSRIIANVDPSDSNKYLESLKKGVAHAEGTSFPGEGGHIFLFAHSTDYFWNISSYNAVFYLLYKLEKGDEINLFYQGRRMVYRVIDKKIVNPSQVEYLTRKTNREFLTLQTCWPPGTTLQRLLVFAQRLVE